MTDSCKDCEKLTADFELATHRGRCTNCFGGYGDSFKADAEKAFVNHVLILGAGDADDRRLAETWRNLAPARRQTGRR